MTGEIKSWKRHRGGNCPRGFEDKQVEVRLRDKSEMRGCGRDFDWSHDDSEADIMAWRAISEDAESQPTVSLSVTVANRDTELPSDAPCWDDAPDWATHLGRDTSGYGWYDHEPVAFTAIDFCRGVLGTGRYPNGVYEPIRFNRDSAEHARPKEFWERPTAKGRDKIGEISMRVSVEVEGSDNPILLRARVLEINGEIDQLAENFTKQVDDLDTERQGLVAKLAEQGFQIIGQGEITKPTISKSLPDGKPVTVPPPIEEWNVGDVVRVIDTDGYGRGDWTEGHEYKIVEVDYSDRVMPVRIETDHSELAWAYRSQVEWVRRS